MAHSQLDLFLSPAVGGLAPTHPVEADGGGSLLSKAERRKEIERLRHIVRYKNNKEKIILLNREYRKNNAEKYKKMQSEYYKANAEKIKARVRAYEKTNREKINHQTRIDRAKNPEKYRTKAKKYRIENKEKLNAARREYAAKNRALYQAYNSKYRTVNKNRLREEYKIYRKKREETDINFKIATRLRSRLYKAIKDSAKKGSAVNDLGCSISFLKQHLESLFSFGMSWENYGKWHVDHIKPLVSFDLTIREQFLKACHFTNLQPLWAKDNISKGKNHQPEGVSCHHQQLS